MAIYTKAGDKGETKVFDEKTKELIKVSKTSKKIKAIGAIDELNSFLGIIKSGSIKNKKIISEIQQNLFAINSILAGTNLAFSKAKTKKLEKQIDNWEGSLPVQKNFLIYGGILEATQVFYARALSRRAERAVVELSKLDTVKESVLIYLNRLSDFLFMLGRSLNFDSGTKEEYWKRGRK